MLDFHKENNADVTIATMPVPIEEASRFGIVIADDDKRINAFEEKPVHPRSNLASMVDVLTWRVKFNRDVDPKGRPASDIYGGTIYVEIESTPDTIVLDKMFKQYQPVNGNIVFKKADEDAKMKELVFENGYVVDYEEALNVANPYPMTIKFAISAQTVKMDEATFVQDWPENN